LGLDPSTALHLLGVKMFGTMFRTMEHPKFFPYFGEPPRVSLALTLKRPLRNRGKIAWNNVPAAGTCQFFASMNGQWRLDPLRKFQHLPTCLTRRQDLPKKQGVENNWNNVPRRGTNKS